MQIVSQHRAPARELGGFQYEEWISAAGPCPISTALPARRASDQFHACQTIVTVQMVSIVAKNRYSGSAGGRPIPISGGMKVRKPFTRVTMVPAMMFAIR